MKRIIIDVAFAICFLTVSTAAQIMSNPTQWYINTQIYSMRVFNGMVANEMIRQKTNQGRQTPTKQANKPAVDYTAFRAQPNSVLPAKILAKSTDRAGTEKLLNTFLSLYRQTAQKDGFPANDLAYAFEYFVVNNYQLYHDLIDLPADKDPRARRAKDIYERNDSLNQKIQLRVRIWQERAIYNQFREVLAANAEIQKMTDAQKQEASELLAIMFGVNFAGYMKGVNDGDDQLTEQARRLAKEGLEKLLGVPIEQIKISNNGLEL